jgi:hypothetical protein
MAAPLYAPGALVQAARDATLVMRILRVTAVVVTDAEGLSRVVRDPTQDGIPVYLCQMDPTLSRGALGRTDRTFREDDLSPFAGSLTEAALAAQAVAAAKAAQARSGPAEETTP